ncbi:MAG: hypothetical protein QF464_22560, partial [Myxococcota bacterium]|nr:hypothetical protein [Myxococcota bacterium]
MKRSAQLCLIALLVAGCPPGPVVEPAEPDVTEPLPEGVVCPSPNGEPVDGECDRPPLDPDFVRCVVARPSVTAPNEVATQGAEADPGCTSCHTGIEDAHPYKALSCTDCHGGDGDAMTKESAHPALPDCIPEDACRVEVLNSKGDLRRYEWRYCDKVVQEEALDGTIGADPASRRIFKLKTGCRTTQLDALVETDEGRALLRFINPGDLRVAGRSCGDGAGNCHQATVDNARRSVMNTFTGHYNLPRFLAGMQDRQAVVGTVDISDPYFDEVAGHPLAVESIEPLRGPEEGWP